MSGFDFSSYSSDPAVQAVWDQEGWTPGAPIGASGDSGIGQMIPSTARHTIALHPELVSQYPELRTYALAPRPADPTQDPISHYLNDPNNVRAAAALSEAHVNDLKRWTPGWEKAPETLFRQYNGSGPKAEAYGKRAAAHFRSLMAGAQAPNEDVAAELQGVAPDTQQPATSAAQSTGLPPILPSQGQYGTWTPEALAARGEPVQPQAPLQASSNGPLAGLEQAFNADQQATMQQAQHQSQALNQKADLLDQVGKQLDQMGGPPQQKAIDPKQYYANIGHALGANSPGSARLVGGIATGIFAGLGTLGAAIAHSHNDALDIIRGGIQDNINAQNQNNQINRQQWADQYGYVLKQVQAKTDALAARSGAQDVIDGAARTNAGATLQFLGDQAKMSLLPPEWASKAARLQSAQWAVMQYEQARRDAFNSPRNINAAIRARGLAVHELAKAVTMSLRGPSDVDEKSAESLMSTTLTPNDWANDNLARVYGWLRAQGDITTQSARGLNVLHPMPSGAVPNNPARPTPTDDEEGDE